MSKSFLCQSIVAIDKTCTQEFITREYVSWNSTTSRNILVTRNKQKTSWCKIVGLFHLGTPKTAFLMKNLTIDPCIQGIFPNKWGYSFQFPKMGRGSLPFSLVVCACLTYLKNLCLQKVPPNIQEYLALILDIGWNKVSQGTQIL